MSPTTELHYELDYHYDDTGKGNEDVTVSISISKSIIRLFYRAFNWIISRCKHLKEA